MNPKKPIEDVVQPLPNAAVIDDVTIDPVEPPQGSIYRIPSGWYKTVDVTDEHLEAILEIEKKLGSKDDKVMRQYSFGWLRLVLREGYHYGLENSKNNRLHYARGLRKFYVKVIKKKNNGKYRIRVTSD